MGGKLQIGVVWLKTELRGRKRGGHLVRQDAVPDEAIVSDQE